MGEAFTSFVILILEPVNTRDGIVGSSPTGDGLQIIKVQMLSLPVFRIRDIPGLTRVEADLWETRRLQGTLGEIRRLPTP